MSVYSLRQDGEKALSPHFKVKEFRCQDGTDIIPIDLNLISKLEALYSRLGCYSIVITSGYRTPAYSVKVGGYATDQHTKGTAADIICYKSKGVPFTINEMLIAAQEVGFTGIGRMRTAIHVDVRSCKSYFDEITGKTGISDWHNFLGISQSPAPKPTAPVARTLTVKCVALKIHATADLGSKTVGFLRLGNKVTATQLKNGMAYIGKGWIITNNKYVK